ncbi:threonine/homoserine/homoserine lactone efflux protein [Archangium gephyra]|uniref:Threonine efflux protein n=1 Tax=Archangium gephyra TaxID=48 RepID=A0AAC8Q196_9BACT|nr:LysE family translocator [Archangium gephyra]AKI98985.1 Putative threonine efflux protein [Archangium gephyra]REG30894.1 threonine/homoserine/homoserine lactone efflux protein [Archangium gephyra]
MEQTAHLWLFFVLVFGVVVLPGLDMAFVLASSLTGGRKAGLSAVAGIIAGGACHVAAGATGVAVLLKVVPSAFNVMLWMGALYVAWMGISIFRSGAAFSAAPLGEKQPPTATFRRGVLTCLLNPKAYVFMLAVFPQFVRPEYGPLWIQALVLGAIIAVTQGAVYGAIALAADRARGWLESNPAANVAAARVVGGLMTLAAVVTVFEGWRSV